MRKTLISASLLALSLSSTFPACAKVATSSRAPAKAARATAQITAKVTAKPTVGKGSAARASADKPSKTPTSPASISADANSFFGQEMPSPALVKGQTLPLEKWWRTPTFSPDGTKVMVQTPPPKIEKVVDPDGKTYYGQLGGPDKTAILDSKDFSVITSVNSEIWAKWSPDSRFFFGNNFSSRPGSLPNGLNICDATSGAVIRSLNPRPPEALSWSPDSKRIFLTQRKAASIIDIEKKTETLLSVKANESYFANPSWSPDGKLIAASCFADNSEDGQKFVRVWDANSRELTGEYKLEFNTSSIVWSADAKTLLCSEPFKISLLDSSKMKLIRTIPTQEDRGVYFQKSWDNKKFLYNDGGTIRILDASSLEEKLHFAGPTNGFCRLSWSPDDKYVLISAQHTAAICDAETGKYLGHKTWPDSAYHIFTPDEKLLIVENLNSLMGSEKITLPPLAGASPFADGKLGSPGWENNATPKTIEECCSLFDKELTAEHREKFKNTPLEQIGKYGGGSFITDGMMANVYGKWSFTDLTKFFNKAGITDHRNFDEVLLVSYWRYLHKLPMQLEEQFSEHRAWTDNNRPVIDINKDLPDDIRDCKLKNKAGQEFTIGDIKAKLKFVTFVDTDGYLSAEQLKCLKDVSEIYPSKEVAIIVCVVPPESLSRKNWPAIQTKVMGHGDQPSKDIANFRSNCGDIIVANAPLALSEALFRSAKAGKYSVFGLPQTLVITEQNQLKQRINKFDEEATPRVFERIIKQTLAAQ